MGALAVVKGSGLQISASLNAEFAHFFRSHPTHTMKFVDWQSLDERLAHFGSDGILSVWFSFPEGPVSPKIYCKICPQKPSAPFLSESWPG